MQKSRVGSVFVLLVFCLFAFGVFVTIMLAASTYQSQNETTMQGQNERILLSYVRTKVRAADSARAIFVGEHHGINALGIHEVLGEGEYSFITYIYFYNGWARELFFEYGLDFAPGESIAIIETTGITFEYVDRGLIRVVTDAGDMYIYPRTGIGTTFGIASTGGDF
ncbi:MAG: DUF4860 domain-containing protein [Defluviitaleaceae bacterium]|nr:DUF4860 domain-containing protein [Defluviitaleaceae bacterium]